MGRRRTPGISRIDQPDKRRTGSLCACHERERGKARRQAETAAELDALCEWWMKGRIDTSPQSRRRGRSPPSSTAPSMENYDRPTLNEGLGMQNLFTMPELFTSADARGAV